MKRGYVDTVHGQIHYLAEGSGEAILMLHITPHSSWDYAPVLPLLGARFQAIAMDTLGYGNSDRPPRRYEIADYARSVVDFLGALGVPKATLVGHATGAAIAGEVAAAYPDRVNRLVLLSYPLYTPEMLRERIQTRSLIAGAEPLALKEDGAHMTAVFRYARSFLGGQASPEEVLGLAVAVLQSGPENDEAHRALWRYFEKGGAERSLSGVKCPVLLLACPKAMEFRARRYDPSLSGARLKEMFDAQTRRLESLIPHAKTVVIGEKAPSLLLPRVAPAEFSRAILDFMADTLPQA